jgi:uncharacterized delta-60 repeat protein
VIDVTNILASSQTQRSAIMVQVQSKSGAGTPDPDFGKMGKVSLPLPGTVGNIPGAIHALPENKLLVAIRALRPENTPAQLVRLNEDGAIDRTFGDSGFVKIPFEDDVLFLPSSSHPLADGGWLIAGSAARETTAGQVRDLAVVRQDQNGKMDNTFGRDGVVIIRIEDLLGTKGARLVSRGDDEKTDEIFSTTPDFLAFPGSAQHDGKIVLVGTIFFGPGNYRGIVLRLDGNGSLDLSLDGKGYLFVNLPGFTEAAIHASGVAVDPDGNVLVCGYVDHPEGLAAYVIRYTRFGAVDKTFGDSKNGLVIIRDDNHLPILFAMTLKPDGGIIAVGGTMGYLEMSGVGLIVVLTADGRFNSDFNAGEPLFSDALKYSRWHRCLLQPDGRIIVSGQGLSIVFNNMAAVAARFLSDGRKDQTFANNGLVVVEDEGGFGNDQGITLRADKRIVLGCTAASPILGAVMCYFG